MGRQLDLYRRNAQISNNPLNTITAGNLAKLIAQPGPDTQKILADGLQEAITNILTWIDTGTGLDLVTWASDLESLLNEAGVEWTNLLGGLNTWLQSVGTDATNAWNNWVTAFENTEQATIADLTTWWNQTQTDATNAWNNWVTILENLGQTTATDFSDLVAAIESNASNAAQNWETVLEDVGIPAATAASFASWLQTLLTPNSALNASNLWGLIPIEAVGQVASTAVVDTSPNPLLNPNFESAISVSPGSGWVWDSTVYYTPPSGDTAPGSAKVAADGVLHALRSNLIPVASGQSLAVSLPVLTSGLTATGTPLELHVITFVGGAQTGITSVTAIAAPTGAATGWVNAPSGSKGGTLSGTYVVASGVTQVQLRLVEDATATAGSVWFGNATASLSGGFLANLQADTNSIIDSFAPGGTAAEFESGVTNLLALFGLTSADIGGATVIDTVWADVVNDIINPLNAIETQAANIIGDIEQSAVAGLTDVWDWLTGTSTPPTSSSTTQVQAGAVPAVGNQANLLDAVQAGWDALVQAFTGTTDTGHGLGGLANAASGTASTAGNALMTAQSATMVQAQQATAKPGYMAIDSTMDAVFPLSHMIAAPTYNNVTQLASTIGFVCIPDNVAKLSVAWLGSYTGTITGLYINVYSMNTSTGVLTRVIAGANYIGSVGNVLSWNYYTLATAIPATVGAVYGVEMAVTGTGTYSLMGLSNSTFPQNSNVFPQALGALRGFTPSHDAAGAGSFPAGTGTTFSWSHSLGASATGIVIEFIAFRSGGPSVSSVKVGTTSATLLGSVSVGGANEIVYMYGLLNPPTGTQTITVTFGAAASFGGNSDSYNSVTSFGTVATNSGASSPGSVSVSSATGQTAVATIFTGGSVSAFNQTSRWNNGNATSGWFGVFGDAAGASTVSFSATAGAGWGAIGVSLVGISAATTPTSIPSPTYSTNVPWFGMGTSAIAATPVFAPETASYTTHGTYTFTLPTWFRSGVDFLDVVAVGPGGGGGGGASSPGSTGTATTVTVGGTTVTAAAGAGGIAGNCPQSSNYGASPGNQIYNGTTYYGGSSSAFGYGLVTSGSSPGGGGAGGGNAGVYAFGGSAGHWVTQTFNPTGTTVSVTVTAGGAASPSFLAEDGAGGAVWLVARQA